MPGHLIACDSDEKADDKAAIPPYKITHRDTSGNQREIEVQVDSAKSLRIIFDDVTKDLTDEAGYTVLINCSTGGSKAADNRLANGTYAVGNIGAAGTGLKDGEKKFEPVEGRTCPDKS
ncbi:hypothetical protein [Streptomyces sp. 8ZJF_21]|uniref:hypothetical protein n=1 Tax=Streptomyces sp. 8ZJF_21 TaxID=2903141 RepID=UPI001E431FFB|nr:hypothetical protein [Streptomyces sp. 8ZJF_21]MCD9592442.1 hypothetical protein [Streptomyces sp. 8ZJF_21]